jgi:hypothetical protein
MTIFGPLFSGYATREPRTEPLSTIRRAQDPEEPKGVPEHQKDAMGGMVPIAISYRGNLPTDIEDRIRHEIKTSLDSVLPGLSEKFPDITLYLEQLPPEALEGSSDD